MNLTPTPVQKFFDNNGRPMSGGLLFTYVAGTSTKVATYTNASGGTPNTNPIVLDFRGEANIWIDPQLAYKFVLAPPWDSDPPTSPIWTVDNITASPLAFDNTSVDTGSVNNISLTIPQISSPVAFTRVIFQAANTNTGATTLQINGGTAHPLVWQSDVRFSGNEIMAGGIYQAIFNGGEWQLQGPTLSPCDLRLYGAIPDGTTDCSAALTAASAASVAGRGDIVIKGGTYRISSSVSIARGACLSFEGGVISIDSGDTLTINGFMRAPRSQIFSGDGSVSLAYGGESTVEVYPEWFGAIPDGVTNCSDAINKAIASAPQCIVSFAAGVYVAEEIELGTASSLYGVSKDESIIRSATATWMVRLNNAVITKCQLTIKDITFAGNNVGTIGIRLINAAHFSIRDCKITQFISKGIESVGAIIYQVIRTEVLTCPIGWEGSSGASYSNDITFQYCQFGGCVTNAFKVAEGAMIVVDGCDIEANGTAGDAATRTFDVRDMDPDGLGIAIVIRDCWLENNSGSAVIVFLEPNSSYTKHIVDSCHIFGGTRTYGIIHSDSTIPSGMHIYRTVAQGASTQDIYAGNNIVGSMIDSRASTIFISTTGTDFIMLSNPANGEYRLGNNLRLSSAGNVTLPILPTTTSYANDAAAAGGGVGIGQLYRNGSIVQVRVT